MSLYSLSSSLISQYMLNLKMFIMIRYYHNGLDPLYFSIEHRLYLLPFWKSAISDYLILLPCGIVVEPSSVRSLAADCPICIIFKLSHLYIFHYYVVVYTSLRSFQQLNRFVTYIPIRGY